jgi:hypothetical protein
VLSFSVFGIDMGESRKFEVVPYLSALSREKRTALLTALRAVAPSLNVWQFAQSVSERAGLEAGDVQQLCLEFSGWFTLVSDDSKFFQGIPNYLITGLAEPPEELKGSEAELRDYIREILQCDRTLGVTLKANEVMWREERVYNSAAVTTEVRPIYGTDPSGIPESAVIIHQLRLSYRSAVGESSLFVAMNIDQLAALQRALERAIRKENTLLRAAAYQYLGKER